MRLTLRARLFATLFASGVAVPLSPAVALALWMYPAAVRADEFTADERKELEACAGSSEAIFACTSRVMDTHLLREATEKRLTDEDRQAIRQEVEKTQQDIERAQRVLEENAAGQQQAERQHLVEAKLALEGIAEGLHFHIATQETHLDNLQRVLDLSTGTAGEAPDCPSGCYPGNIHKCVCGRR